MHTGEEFETTKGEIMNLNLKAPLWLAVVISASPLLASGEAPHITGAKQHFDYAGTDSEVSVDFLPDSANAAPTAALSSPMDFSRMSPAEPDGILLITFKDKQTGVSTYMPLSSHEIREALPGWKADAKKSKNDRNCSMFRELIKKFKPRKVEKSTSDKTHGKKE